MGIFKYSKMFFFLDKHKEFVMKCVKHILIHCSCSSFDTSHQGLKQRIGVYPSWGQAQGDPGAVVGQ